MPCMACGSRCFRWIARNKFFEGTDIVECHSCGLIFPYPLPPKEKVDTFYSEDYYQYNFVETWFKKRIGTLFARSRKKWMGDWDVPLDPVQRVLEIGAGYGSLLKALGIIDMLGIEPSTECHVHSVVFDFFGAKLQQSTFENAKYYPPYDLIILSHVLEHLLEPRKAIDKLRNLLKPRGWLYIEIPNKFSPVYSAPSYQNVPDFYFFNRKGFEGFLSRHDLEGVISNVSIRGWQRFDKVGCAVNYLYWEALNLLGISLLYPGDGNSFAISAAVQKQEEE